MGGRAAIPQSFRRHPPLGIQARRSQSRAKTSESHKVSTRPSVRIFLRSKKEKEEEAEDHFRKGAITINKLTVNSYFGIDVVTKQ